MIRALPLLLVSSIAVAAEPEAEGSYLLGKSPLEIVVVPAQVQVSVITEHIGAQLAVNWHLHDGFAVQLSGFYNYLSGPTALHRRIDGSAFELQVPRPLSLSVWGALA